MKRKNKCLGNGGRIERPLTRLGKGGEEEARNGKVKERKLSWGKERDRDGERGGEWRVEGMVKSTSTHNLHGMHIKRNEAAGRQVQE